MRVNVGVMVAVGVLVGVLLAVGVLVGVWVEVEVRVGVSVAQFIPPSVILHESAEIKWFRAAPAAQ